MSNNDDSSTFDSWKSFVAYYLVLLDYCECAFDGVSFTWTYEGSTTYDFHTDVME